MCSYTGEHEQILKTNFKYNKINSIVPFINLDRLPNNNKTEVVPENKFNQIDTTLPASRSQAPAQLLLTRVGSLTEQEVASVSVQHTGGHLLRARRCLPRLPGKVEHPFLGFPEFVRQTERARRGVFLDIPDRCGGFNRACDRAAVSSE